MTAKGLTKQIGDSFSKNSPAILTGLGLFGFGAAIVFAVEATPKAQSILEDLQYEYSDEPVPKIEVVKRVAPVYIPTTLMVLVSATCIISAYKINSKRLGILAGLYSVSEAALKEYQAKVIETFGEKKEGSVRDAIAQDKIDRNPASQNQIIITGKGDSLCYDAWSGQYFESDYEKVRSAVNSINADLLNGEMWCSLNEFYYYLGIAPTEGGVDIGFDVDNRMDVRFSSHITDTGRTALVMSFVNKPKPRF